MFGPLYFQNAVSSRFNLEEPPSSSVPCLLCPSTFNFPLQQEIYFTHLFTDHNLVIADVHKIPKIVNYLQFWEKKLTPDNLKVYCSTILCDVEVNGVNSKNQEYFLLSDIEPTDKELRESLQRERLEEALEQQTFEREDTTFRHGCLFCRLEIEPTRAEFLNHLSSKHNLQLGRPENLVYIDKYISIIKNKMENLQCIYCEKFFKDRNVLKEHMRKKQHKRVNPNNKIYDKFYITNYLEMGNSWKKEKERRDSTEDTDDPNDWSDWQELLQVSIVCLFCETVSPDWEGILRHLLTEHKFDYEANTAGLGFYEQLKLVNFIRRQVYKCKCVSCEVEVESRAQLLEHMESENHMVMPPRQLWDQPEFYFPTYENDAFLCQLDDNKDLDPDSELSDSLSAMNVIQEDIPRTNVSPLFTSRL